LGVGVGFGLSLFEERVGSVCLRFGVRGDLLGFGVLGGKFFEASQVRCSLAKIILTVVLLAVIAVLGAYMVSNVAPVSETVHLETVL